jgi:DNA polymerase-3 subunit delta
MSNPPTFYIFHGEDEFSIANQVTVMRQQMGDKFNISEVDGTKASVLEVVSLVRVLPFLGDKRLVIVREMLSHLSRRGAPKSAKEDLEFLVEALPNLPASARLVFWETKAISDKNPVIKIAQQSPAGYVKQFEAPRNVARWLEKAAQDYGVTIQPQAAIALANVVGKDLRTADGELLKLAAYVGEKGVITPQEVALLTAYVAEADIFAMADALGQRDGKTAMSHLNRLLDSSQPLQLFSMIIRQFRLLILAREWLDNGGGVSELPKALNVHPFVAQKIGAQARVFPSLSDIEIIYRYLLETDVAIKTGKVKDRLGLEILVAALSRAE